MIKLLQLTWINRKITRIKARLTTFPTLIVLLILNLSLAHIVFAGDFASSNHLQLSKNDDYIQVDLNNLDYPNKTVVAELHSGLPNTLTLSLTLRTPSMQKSQDKVIARHDRIYTITYDLWDEHYVVQKIDNSGATDHIFHSQKALLTELRNISVSDCFELSPLSVSRDYVVEARIIFNPVTRARIEKVKEWIAKSNGYNTPEAQQPNNRVDNFNAINLGNGLVDTDAGPNNGTRSSGPRFKKFFDLILEQYLSNDAVAAQWSSDTLKQTFNLEYLKQSLLLNDAPQRYSVHEE